MNSACEGPKCHNFFLMFFPRNVKVSRDFFVYMTLLTLFLLTLRE